MATAHTSRAAAPRDPYTYAYASTPPPPSSSSASSSSATTLTSAPASRVLRSPLDDLVRRTSSRRQREITRERQEDRYAREQGQGQGYARQQQQREQGPYQGQEPYYDYQQSQQPYRPQSQQSSHPSSNVPPQAYAYDPTTSNAQKESVVDEEEEYEYNYDEYYGAPSDDEDDARGGYINDPNQQHIYEPTHADADTDSAYATNAYTYDAGAAAAAVRPASTSGPQLAQYAYSHRPRGMQAAPATSNSYNPAPNPNPSTSNVPTTTNNPTPAPPPRPRPAPPLRLEITPPNELSSNAPAGGGRSPLLHSHFAPRDSVATHRLSGASGVSGMSGVAQGPSQGRAEYRYLGGQPFAADDDASVYSREQGPALRDSWRSTETGGAVQRPDYYGAGERGVVVKAAVASVTRPATEQAHPVHAEHMGERVTVQLPAEMQAGKAKVLERNARRAEPEPQGSGGGGLRVPGARTTTPASALYSQYSYYSYQSPVPSPLASQFEKPKGKGKSRTPSPAGPPSPGPTTAEEYLQLGIQHHEANRLQESARCFERSATEGGGCGVGMLMYGLTLRHGWGCRKNESLGFKWLMRAAESAVGDLERVRLGGGGAEVGTVERELVLAIYEVGQCFFHGWGVGKDQKMGVSYYAVAARLGDGDAQNDLAFCLANGKGCKKDKRGAAEWYRAAVLQGQSNVGLAWIYKDKYQ